MAIRQKASTLTAVKSVYGIGSFFHKRSFNDLDLVAVVDCRNDELVQHGAQIRGAFRDLSTTLGISVDLTIFTLSEFARGPLRHMSSLVPIYERTS